MVPELNDHIGHGAHGTAQFSLIVSGGDVDGLDGLGGRNHDLQKARPLIVIDALNLIAVALTRLAVYLGLDGTCRVKKLRVLEDWRPDPWHQSEQTLEILIDRDRHAA